MAFGLEPRFKALIISAEVGCAKPDAAIFAFAVDALGLDRLDIWHVGDSLRVDIAGAQAAGLEAVWLNRNARMRTATDPVPDYEIRSFDDLRALMRSQK